jgi:hypothetical protein
VKSEKVESISKNWETLSMAEHAWLQLVTFNTPQAFALISSAWVVWRDYMTRYS